MSNKINEYNKKMSNKLGWTPEWFGCSDFDDSLIEAIKKFQKSLGLTADGMCGEGTFRRVYNERLSDLAETSSGNRENRPLIYMGNEIDIEWDKVTRWIDEDGLNCGKGFSDYTEKREIKMFVNHWDVCLNSKSCAKVLAKRGISVHFCIDNDGTIHQLVDINDATWHAGSRTLNHSTVGVEIANAFYPKYQSWYKKNGFGERPIISGETVHGNKIEDFTGFYPIQLEALKALWKAMEKHIGIPLDTPTDSNGNSTKEVYLDAANNKFKGFVSHYHLTKRKMDCAGLNIAKMIKDIKK